MGDRAATIRLREYEPVGIRPIRTELIPRCAELLERMDGIISAVFAGYEESAAEIADLAFVARMDLRRRQSRFEAMSAHTDTWEYLEACESICRWVLKTTMALQQVIAEHHGSDAPGDWSTAEIERSLRVRRAYAAFRKHLDPDTPPTAETMHRRMRLVGITLAKLMGQDAYDDMRVRDRRALHELQGRVLDWLRGKSELTGDGVASGARLWQDIVGLSSLMMQVNKRDVLCEHDTEILRSTYETLFGGLVPATRVRSEMLDKLAAVYGLDPALDLCLDAGPEADMEAWRTSLLSALRVHSISIEPPSVWANGSSADMELPAALRFEGGHDDAALHRDASPETSLRQLLAG